MKNNGLNTLLNKRVPVYEDSNETICVQIGLKNWWLVSFLWSGVTMKYTHYVNDVFHDLLHS